MNPRFLEILVPLMEIFISFKFLSLLFINTMQNSKLEWDSDASTFWHLGYDFVQAGPEEQFPLFSLHFL